jgi:hypothetical protein
MAVRLQAAGNRRTMAITCSSFKSKSLTALNNNPEIRGVQSVIPPPESPLRPAPWIIFVPMFVGWAFILSRYPFNPFSVFLLFGLTGTMAETTFGPQHLLEFGLWIFVYGLMVYLPAYCVPSERPTRSLRWWHYPLAVVVPFLFLPLVPLPAVSSRASGTSLRGFRRPMGVRPERDLRDDWFRSGSNFLYVQSNRSEAQNSHEFGRAGAETDGLTHD